MKVIQFTEQEFDALFEMEYELPHKKIKGGVKIMTEVENQDIKYTIKDMEVVENFLSRKGRFVGGMISISIHDLAEIIRKTRKPIKPQEYNP